MEGERPAEAPGEAGTVPREEEGGVPCTEDQKPGLEGTRQGHSTHPASTRPWVHSLSLEVMQGKDCTLN